MLLFVYAILKVNRSVMVSLLEYEMDKPGSISDRVHYIHFLKNTLEKKHESISSIPSYELNSIED